MRILYISKSVIPSRTANSIHVMKMCEAFADNGHEVILLAHNVLDILVDKMKGKTPLEIVLSMGWIPKT